MSTQQSNQTHQDALKRYPVSAPDIVVVYNSDADERVGIATIEF